MYSSALCLYRWVHSGFQKGWDIPGSRLLPWHRGLAGWLAVIQSGGSRERDGTESQGDASFTDFHANTVDHSLRKEGGWHTWPQSVLSIRQMAWVRGNPAWRPSDRPTHRPTDVLDFSQLPG